MSAKEAIAGMVLVVALTWGTATPAYATASAPTPIVVGNHIVDSRTSSTWTPHGVNWPSFEYACWQGWGYSAEDATASAATAMASWKINTVRIPLNQDCWLGLNSSPVGVGRTATGYRAAVHAWVDILNAAGIVAILDLHSSAPAGQVAHGQRAMADAQSLTFWSQVGAEYATDPSVMFDAFNEPYSRWNPVTNDWAFDNTWSCWKNGGCQAPVEDDYTATLSGTTYSTAGMTSIVAAIRGAGAAQPILLGGLDYSNDLRGWLANRPADDQLVASWHNYPGQRCDTPSCWNSEIAPVAAVVPVFVGEFGETDGGSTFLTSFMNWADAQGIGYSPWAWWKVDASEDLTNSRYALVSGAAGTFTPKAPAGTTYRNHLLSLGNPASTTPIALVNGDLESGSLGWKRLSTHLLLNAHSDSGLAHTGAGYLAAKGSISDRSFGQTGATTVLRGDTFAVTVWIRAASTAEAVHVKVLTIGGVAESRMLTVTATTAWVPVTVRLPITRSGHSGIRIAIYLHTKNRAIYFDDASLTVTR